MKRKEHPPYPSPVVTSDDLARIRDHVKCACGNMTVRDYAWVDASGNEKCPQCVVEKLKDAIHKLTRR